MKVTLFGLGYVGTVTATCLADSAAGAGSNRRVALLGLSFKHNTDDLRESPNVALAEILLGKGLDVRIHDAVVNPATLSGANLAGYQGVGW